MRNFGGFRSSRRYHPNQEREILNFRVVPDLQISKQVVFLMIYIHLFFTFYFFVAFHFLHFRHNKKNDLDVLLENRLTSVRVRGRGDFIFYFIFFALEVQGSKIK